MSEFGITTRRSLQWIMCLEFLEIKKKRQFHKNLKRFCIMTEYFLLGF
jgi:hypothetical protein